VADLRGKNPALATAWLNFFPFFSKQKRAKNGDTVPRTGFEKRYSAMIATDSIVLGNNSNTTEMCHYY